MPPSKSTGTGKKAPAKKTAAKPVNKSGSASNKPTKSSEKKPATKAVSKSTPSKAKTTPKKTTAKVTTPKAKPAATQKSAPKTTVKTSPPKAPLELAVAANAAGKTKDAIKHYTVHLAQNPKDAESHLALGQLHMAQNDPEAALPCYEHAYDFLPNRVDVGYTLANLYHQTGAISKAQSLWTILLAKTEVPGEIQAILTNLVQTYLKQGQTESALRLIHEEALNAPLLASLAYLQAGNSEPVIGILQKTLSASPEDPQLHLLAGLAYYSGQHLSEALYHLEAVEKHGKLPPAVQQIMAHTLWQRGDTTEALHRYEALPAKFRNAQTWLNLGWLYYETQHVDQAIPCFEKALKSSEHSAKAAYGLAQCAIKQKDWTAALSAFQKALKNSPSNPEWLYESGLVAYQAGVYHQAIDAWVKALELAPGRGDIFAVLGHACYQVGAYDRAASAYKEALSLGCNDASLILALGHAYFSLHQFEDAAVTYLNALEKGLNHAELQTWIEQARQFAASA